MVPTTEPFSQFRFVVRSSFAAELDLHWGAARCDRHFFTVDEGHDMEAKPTKSERKAALAKLAELYPACFTADASGPHRPLKIGIHRDLIERGMQPSEVQALMPYAKRAAYKAALIAGGARYDLDGNPHGEVTAEEIAAAKVTLANIEKRIRAAHEQKKLRRIEPQRIDAEANRVARIEREPMTTSRLSLADLKAAAQARKAAERAA
jgi:ProP effector